MKSKLLILLCLVPGLLFGQGLQIPSTPYTRQLMRSTDGATLGSNINKLTFFTTNTWESPIVFKNLKPQGVNSANSMIEFQQADGRKWWMGVSEQGEFQIHYNDGTRGFDPIMIDTNGVVRYQTNTSFQSMIAQAASPAQFMVVLQNFGTPMAFAVQPTNQSVVSNENFSVVALVTNAINVSYTWYHIPTNGLYTNAQSAASTYTTNAQDWNIGTYYCVARNSAYTITSSIVTIDYAATLDVYVGLENYWKFDEVSGTRSDSKGGNHLTDNYPEAGTPVMSGTGVQGNDASFDVAYSHFLSGNTLSLSNNTEWSINCWLTLPNVESQNAFMLSDGDWGNGRSLDINCYVTSTNSMNITVDVFDLVDSVETQHTSGQLAVDSSVWTMLTVTYTNSTVYVYTNSTLATSFSCGTAAPTSYPLIFGAWSASGTPQSFQTGQIDEFGKWNRTLIQEEINYLFNNGAGRTYTP